MEQRQNLAPLTAMRFFAAAAIVVFHLHNNWGLPGPQDTGLMFGIGVNLFFVLSGFILAYTYRRIDGFDHAIKIVAYRVARIWPLHIAMLGLFYLLVYDASNPFHDIHKLWASVFLLQAWFGDYTYSFNGNPVAWTLSLELFFYLTFPLLTIMSSRWIVAITLLVTTLTLSWAFAVPVLSAPLDLPGTTAAGIVRMHPGSFFVLFAAGILACRMFISREWQIGPRAATVWEVLCLLFAGAYFLRNEQIAGSIANFLHVGGIPALWMQNAMGAVFFTPLIFVLAIGRGRLSQALSVRPLIILGEASFAIYLLHLMVQDKAMAIGFATPSDVPAYLCIVLVGSVALNRYIEMPSNRYLRRKVDAWADRRVVAARPVI
ncbi:MULTISPECIES: acyltransferase [unclassified Mesorhizobium]|uniref:acyltransferase family protein n=1 Tax=unclassified Mesorhizobium TaxID=325217 RepID=UPI0003CF2113|nr:MULTISPECIES: acyltransferase [unclassified Mesorhizobium]ESY16120.1 hypothetical protein X750_27180 [Mesorhizobium sp. LNJC394B00]